MQHTLDGRQVFQESLFSYININIYFLKTQNINIYLYIYNE